MNKKDTKIHTTQNQTNISSKWSAIHFAVSDSSSFFIKYIVFKLTYILKNVRTPIICYCLVYSTTLVVILSLTTMNTGIALRQKYMILPFLFIIGAMAAKDYYIKLKYKKTTLR
jgi:hypothetical protein